MRILFYVLAVFATSALTGAMTLIWYVFGSYWRSLSQAAFLDWFGTFGPLTGHVMFSLAGVGGLGLLVSLWLDRADKRARLYWVGAFVCLAGVDWITFAYEVPLNHAFEARTLPLDQVSGAIDSWMRWHVGRVLFGLAAAVLATVALARRAVP